MRKPLLVIVVVAASIAGAAVAWAHSCAAASQKPCFQGRLAASGYRSAQSPAGVVVLTLPQASLTQLLPWTLSGTLIAGERGFRVATFGGVADLRTIKSLRGSSIRYRSQRLDQAVGLELSPKRRRNGVAEQVQVLLDLGN